MANGLLVLHGGAATLGDLEVQRAIVYMVSRARTPVPATLGNERGAARPQIPGKSAPTSDGKLPMRY